MGKAAELRELNDADLEHRLDDTRHELFTARFKMATGQFDNSARIGQLRKEVAQINTLVREREIAAAETGEGLRAPADKKGDK